MKAKAQLGVREPTSVAEIRQLAEMTDNPVNAERYRALAFGVLMGADLENACVKAWEMRRAELAPGGAFLSRFPGRGGGYGYLSRCKHGENLCLCGCGMDVAGRRKLPESHRVHLRKRVAAYLAGRRARWTIPKQAVDFLLNSRFLTEDERRLFSEAYTCVSLRDKGLS